LWCCQRYAVKCEKRFWESWPAGMGKFIFAWGGIYVCDIPGRHSGRAIHDGNTSLCHFLVYRWLPCLFLCATLYWPILISHIFLLLYARDPLCISHGKTFTCFVVGLSWMHHVRLLLIIWNFLWILLLLPGSNSAHAPFCVIECRRAGSGKDRPTYPVVFWVAH